MFKTATYEGEDVMIVRNAREGDLGYSATMVTQQVVIRLKNDEQRVVPLSDLNQGQYKDQPVTIERPAQLGDDGYTKNGDQVLITMGDGSQRVVAKSDVSAAKKADV